VGLGEIRQAGLTINYRTPEEVMAEAAPVIRAAVPDANVPTSVRASGRPVRHGSAAGLETGLEAWPAGHPHGTASLRGAPGLIERDGVRSLTAETAKGLEFDLVVLVEHESRADEGIEGAVDRYVGMTRATQQLVVLTEP